MNLDQKDITLLLNRINDNDARVIDKIYPLVYEHLRNEAHLQTALTFFNTNPDRYQNEIDEIHALGF